MKCYIYIQFKAEAGRRYIKFIEEGECEFLGYDDIFHSERIIIKDDKINKKIENFVNDDTYHDIEVVITHTKLMGRII